MGQTRTITALEIQKRNKERVNVYLDGEFAFGLNLMAAAQLRKGQQLSEADIAILRDDDAVTQAIERAIRLLARRPRSIQEIRRKLQDKDIPETVINAAIERLTERGYLDDREFARYWVENRQMFKPMGARALRYELRQKGISHTIIDQILAEMVEDDSAAYLAAQKRAPRLRGKTQAEFRQKLSAYLQRRGFGYDAIRQAIAQLIEAYKAEDPSFFTSEVEGE